MATGTYREDIRYDNAKYLVNLKEAPLHNYSETTLNIYSSSRQKMCIGSIHHLSC